MTVMATDHPRIGDLIRRARERRRWTQQQLADRIHVDRKTVDNWENDRSYPRSAIGALEQELGISFSDGPHRTATREEMLEAVRRMEAEARRVRAMLGDDTEANGDTPQAS